MNIYATRHGHRADATDNPLGRDIPVGRPLDPDISMIGELQATQLGIRLNKEAKIKKIYASPFLRTAHTAHQIAKEVGVPVFLEWGVTERFYEQWYSRWPGTMERQQLAARFNTIDLSYQMTGIMPKCPEGQWDSHDRLMKVIPLLGDEDMLIVTHGEPLIAITMGLGGWQQQPLPAPYLCGLSHLEKVGDVWHKRLVVCTSHMEKALI